MSAETGADAQHCWLDEQTHATVLAASFIDRFDTEEPAKDEKPASRLIAWHPHTIYLEVCDSFGLDDLPRHNFDKLMAVKALWGTDLYTADLPAFIVLCNVLYGGGFGGAHLDLADAEECAWGLTEAALLGLPGQVQAYAPEIRRYIDKVCAHEGLLHRPDVLRLAETTPTFGQLREVLADLPGAYEAAMQVGEARAAALVAGLRKRLRQLVEQLEQLPLQHGNARAAVSRWLQVLQEQRTSASAEHDHQSDSQTGTGRAARYLQTRTGRAAR